jgi:hypothetical protein
VQLDGVLDSLVEPHLEEKACEERLRRKSAWVVRKAAVLAARKAAPVVVPRVRATDYMEEIASTRHFTPDEMLSYLVNLPLPAMIKEMQQLRTMLVNVISMRGAQHGSVPVSPLFRLLCLPHAEMLAELSHLRSSSVAVAAATSREASAHEAGRAALADQAAAAAAADVGAPLVGSWVVDHELFGLGICHSCFRGFEPGQARAVFEVALSEEQRAQQPAATCQRRELYHLACRAPACNVHELRGLDTLRSPAARQEVLARMGLVTAAPRGTVSARGRAAAMSGRGRASARVSTRR